MSTEAADLTPGAAQASTPAEASTGWRLDTANGSMVPRSALDVLVDLNDKVTTGNVGEYQPVPLGFTPVPLVMGDMVVLLGGAALGSRLGMAAQVLYLAAGIAGLPVFAASATLPSVSFSRPTR